MQLMTGLSQQKPQQPQGQGAVRFEDGSVGPRKATPQYGNVRFEDGSIGMLRPNPQQFKMYEDQSFQGDPRQFMQQNPGYRFYEDNTFSAPRQQPQADPMAELRRFLGL